MAVNVDNGAADAGDTQLSTQEQTGKGQDGSPSSESDARTTLASEHDSGDADGSPTGNDGSGATDEKSGTDSDDSAKANDDNAGPTHTTVSKKPKKKASSDTTKSGTTKSDTTKSDDTAKAGASTGSDNGSGGGTDKN